MRMHVALSGPCLQEAGCPKVTKQLSCQSTLRQAGQSNFHTHSPFLQSKLGKTSWSGELGKEVRMITRLKSLEGRKGQGRRTAAQPEDLGGSGLSCWSLLSADRSHWQVQGTQGYGTQLRSQLKFSSRGSCSCITKLVPEREGGVQATR